MATLATVAIIWIGVPVGAHSPGIEYTYDALYVNMNGYTDSNVTSVQYGSYGNTLRVLMQI